jgi:streptomycin 6-kinase
VADPPIAGLPHPGLRWIVEEQDEDGLAWLERLPGLIRGCAEAWELRLDSPFAYAQASIAMPATRAGGERVVLKVQFPHREATHEAEALRRWDGSGAVRLLAHDPDRSALLLEPCEPGDALSTAPPDLAFEVLAELLPRLWVEADAPFTRLEDEASWWASTLERDWEVRGRPGDPRLVEEALAAIEDLSRTQPERVLVHQDLHGDNVLSAAREPWLAIDPKPLVGERAFSLAPIVRSDELGHSREQVIRRLDDLSERLGVDRERARRWTIAQTVAWGGGGEHLEAATWLLDA